MEGVPQRADTIDLETLHLKPGEGRRLDTRVRIHPVELGGQRYAISDDAADTKLDVSRTVSGYALRLRFDAPVRGACMRCMGDADPVITVDAREVDQPGDAEELHSPYLDAGLLDLAGWSRDALVLAQGHNNLGNTLGGQGRFDEAIAEYRAAIAAKRDYYQAHYGLDWALGLAGRFEESAEAYAECLRINPNHTEARERLEALRP